MAEKRRKTFSDSKSCSLDSANIERSQLSIEEYNRLRDRSTASWLKKSTEKLTRLPEYMVRTGSLKNRKIFNENSRLSALFTRGSTDNLVRFHSLKLPADSRKEGRDTTELISQKFTGKREESDLNANSICDSYITECTSDISKAAVHRTCPDDIVLSTQSPSYVLQTGCYLWAGGVYHRDSYIMQRREASTKTRRRNASVRECSVKADDDRSAKLESESKAKRYSGDLGRPPVYPPRKESLKSDQQKYKEKIYGELAEAIYEIPSDCFNTRENQYEIPYFPQDQNPRLPDLEEFRKSVDSVYWDMGKPATESRIFEARQTEMHPSSHRDFQTNHPQVQEPVKKTKENIEQSQLENSAHSGVKRDEKLLLGKQKENLCKLSNLKENHKENMFNLQHQQEENSKSSNSSDKQVNSYSLDRRGEHFSNLWRKEENSTNLPIKQTENKLSKFTENERSILDDQVYQDIDLETKSGWSAGEILQVEKKQADLHPKKDSDTEREGGRREDTHDDGKARGGNYVPGEMKIFQEFRFKRMLEYKEPPPYSETDKQMIPDRQTRILNGSTGFSDIRGSNLKSRMRKRIEDLENEKKNVELKTIENERLGSQLSTQFQLYADTKEIKQFSVHIQELGSVSCLILGLVCRLAKVESTLKESNFSDNLEEFQVRERRDRIFQQLEEARWIKRSIDKRSNRVECCVEKYLGYEGLLSYQEYIRWKLDYLTETRELEDKLELSRRELRRIDVF
ncbi:uncharacterized protein LOC111711846 isoform X2 [Eurytemora carolleeae]|uniref:uncharacterized protein LOC111711846 isoform X2 n=1 Tax=Eurytemora carolleeae TaxID=1294199 RepID=UPI000C758783|nr:uncharacterized protein LOC111711846 isoform X2 [Eurytemora carolleeae]|eukprot:XP_023342076.1 uncharacterized protein LOC111711846 isoform X2 [Eurytemora affinis]